MTENKKNLYNKYNVECKYFISISYKVVCKTINHIKASVGTCVLKGLTYSKKSDNILSNLFLC